MSFEIHGYGIGGRIGRPFPSCRPVRSAVMNISSVHLPRPVSGSGVRLAVKLTPHGPANAVLVPAPIHTQGPAGISGGVGMTRLDG